ncbi:MAG: NYN domain-containing protein [Candidatus Eisenbacteria bacterium]|uniref:NYN domain-containing protein n=1 Tax=Eiseniibacteriota bacterium TaxID=2212470 RepID=A0A933S9W1_UNCEI|nr:NYN domain-containing protein [Candidatus Eisenbacteria bacterium]
MGDRVAFLLDGGFVRAKFTSRIGHFPEAQDVILFVHARMAHPQLADASLFRIYWYDAPPLAGRKTHPLSREPYLFESRPTFGRNQRLQDSLATTADVAVRRGEVVFQGWRLRDQSLAQLRRASRPLEPGDIAPNFEQKGVDLRIGLDVAWLSLKRIVDTIVLVSGDSDFIPAMKFARREGVRVLLETLGHGVHRGMREHADFVFESLQDAGEPIPLTSRGSSAGPTSGG